MHDRAGEPIASTPAPRGPALDAASVIAFGTAPPGSGRSEPPHREPNDLWHRGPLPTIAGYEIRGVAGVGGLGVVFDAEQEHPRRRVAIKVTRPELVADDRLRESVLRRFESEVAHASRLHHPYILPVYDAGFFGESGREQPYLAMEFLDAPSLVEYARAHALIFEAKLELLAKVAEGVHYAHLNGVVHRDLKPSNVVVRESGLPAIRDFSLAWSQPQELADRERVTEPGSVVCTFDYAAPEQLIAGGRAIEATDIYALGVMVHELLTDELPYDCSRRDLPDLLRAIADGRLRPISQLRRRLGADAAAVIVRALDPVPARRHASADELAADLRAICRGDRPSGRRPTAWDDLCRYARRHRAVMAGAGLAIAATVAGTATTLWQANLAQRHAATAEARSERLATLAQRVIFEITSAAEGLPASTAGRSLLLDRGIAALREIAEASPGNQALHESLGFALVYLARVLGDPVRPNVGDRDRAKAVAELAIETLAASPRATTDARCLAARADAHAMLGRMIGADDPPEALDRFRAAHALSTDLLELHSRDEHGRLGAAHVMLQASQLVLDEARTWIDEELPRTTTRLEAIAARIRAESAAISSDEAVLVADICDSLARVAAAIGRTTEATRLIDEAERVLQENADPSAFACTVRLVNLERTRAEIGRAAGDPEKELAQRRRALERASDYASGLPEGAPPYLTPIRAALEFAECAVRVQLDADTATLEALRITKAHHDRDPTDAGAKAPYAEAIRYRMSLLEARADGDPELASLRRLLDELLAE